MTHHNSLAFGLQLPPFGNLLSRGLFVSGLVIFVALTPVAAEEGNAVQLAGLVPDLKAGLTAAETRIKALEDALDGTLIRIRELEGRIGQLNDGLNEARIRILRLETGNPAWIENVEAAARARKREIEESRERLRNAPRGKTLNELWRVGER